MPTLNSVRSRPVFCLFLLLTTALTATATSPSTRPNEGLRQHPPSVHALTGCRIVIAAGRVIESGTLVIRDGTIAQVGSDVEIPNDAWIWELDGKTLYPGFLDAFSEIKILQPDASTGAPYWNSQVQPQLSVAAQLTIDTSIQEKFRSQGITARLVAPKSGVVKGMSALVNTSDDSPAKIVIRSDVALHVRLTTEQDWHSTQYPNSPMGAVALARQAMFDAKWYHKAWDVYRVNSSLKQPEWNDALEVLQTFVDSERLVIIDADNEQFLLRADQYAREFVLHIAVRGSGTEYRRINAVQSTGRTVIVPVDFPQAPNVSTPEAALNVTLEQLMHWDLAPENPARLDQAGVSFALTSHGLEDVSKFLEKVRTAVARGLSPDTALRALTTTPAALLGVGDRMGTLEVGRVANIVVTDGEVFDETTKLLETWVQGRRFQSQKRPQIDLRGKWELNFEEKNGSLQGVYLKLTGESEKLAGQISQQNSFENEKELSELHGVSLRNSRFNCTFDAAVFQREGRCQLTAMVTNLQPPTRSSQSRHENLRLAGKWFWPDGSYQLFEACWINKVHEKDTEQDVDKDSVTESKPQIDPKSSFDVNYPLGAFGRSGPPVQRSQVLFRGATIWTCSDAGTLENASLLVGDGKILAVGPNIESTQEMILIDAHGWHISPGIIDCHSHMATDGGINESAQAITAEVRIGDFINDRDIAIYRQLAGGVTVANILHGSANPIGGQNQVIKLRWGTLGEELKMREAPAGIKFALGENVKQSNWGDKYKTRYPQTRMGVEQIIRDALTAAREYRQSWLDWRATRRGLPPRIDLELEALAEVVQGKRWIHCHAYRQDEMLALMQTLDDFGITIGTYQHVLEGYKIADAMVRHGAMGSAFSDWWAYKFEVYDAIPYNGALMFHAGVNVSFNSDSRELARHLNQEAAKAVKYGGVPTAEALKFVTLNPAKQLRIDQYVGSIQIGKDADLAVWNGPPLSNFSRCLQTWIDGRKYFDLDEDHQQRSERDRKHQTLVQKILTLKAPMLDVDQIPDEDKSKFCQEDQCCHPHHF